MAYQKITPATDRIGEQFQIRWYKA